jgi:hypothetical protein
MNEVNRRMATGSCTQRPASRAMRVSAFGRRRHSTTSRAQMRRPSYVHHYDRALIQAHKASELGFPGPDLQDELKAAGKWKDPEQKPAMAAEPKPLSLGDAGRHDDAGLRSLAAMTGNRTGPALDHRYRPDTDGLREIAVLGHPVPHRQIAAPWRVRRCRRLLRDIRISDCAEHRRSNRQPLFLDH